MTHINHSLQSLTDAFADWRQSRPHRRSPVPDNLRQQTVAMLTQHSFAQVKDALGITRKMLNGWCHHDDSFCEDTAFISLPLSEPHVPENLASITLTLTLNSAQQVCLEGVFSQEQLTALMRGVVAGMEQA